MPAEHEAEREDGARRLLALYWEQFAEEQVSLEEFVRRAAAGRYGSCSPPELKAFLEAVEHNILANIETMAATNPDLAPLAEERAAETQEMIADLIARYATQA
nr:hypothetical protein [Bacillota bacterium]